MGERDFFLAGEEQRKFLSLIMDKYHCNAILWDKKKGYHYEKLNKSDISKLDFSKFEWGAKIDFQREDIKEKIMYADVELPEGIQKEIDFIRSGLVEFEPCILVKKRKILLMGRIAIMSPSYYEEAGFDKYKELKAWYTKLGTDLKKFCATHESIVASDDAKAEYNNIYYGREACEFSLKGGKLKQFLEGPVVFYPKTKEDKKTS